MKNSKLMLSTALAISTMLGVGAASAADLPMRAMPYTAPAPVFSWTGFYVGGNAGAGVLQDQGFQDAGPPGPPGPPGPAGPPGPIPFDRHGVGGLAGGQIGFNYQLGMLVLGIEGEGFWSGMKITRDVFNVNTLIASGSIKNKWDYDVAGRFGIALDRALVYGKAGWVFGGFDWNASNIVPLGSINGSATLDGLLIGLGLEYAFTNNWTAKFEYDYLGFIAKNVSFTTSCPTCAPATLTQNVSADKHIFKVGFNYLFNGAALVVAKY